MVTAVDGALEKVRARLALRRLRLNDGFADFDRLRRGRITAEQFHRVLTSSGAELSPSEVHAICEQFKDSNPNHVGGKKTLGSSTAPGSGAVAPSTITAASDAESRENAHGSAQDSVVDEVNYVAFLAALTAATNAMAASTQRSGDAGASIGNGCTRRLAVPATLSSEEEARLQPTVQLLRHAVQARGLNVVPPFYDMDPLRTGKVTVSQFTRCIPFASSLDPVAVDLLARKYGDGQGSVYYMPWCAAIDPSVMADTTATSKVAGGGDSWSATAAATTSFFGGTYRNPGLPADELVRLLREQAALYRLRCEDYFRDFDPFRKGTVTAPQFESALGRLQLVRFALTSENIDTLVAAYRAVPEGRTNTTIATASAAAVPCTSDGDGGGVYTLVDYSAFVYDINPKHFPVQSAAGQPSANYFLATHAPDTFVASSKEQEEAQVVLEKVRRLVQANRIYLSPVLRDFDRVRKAIYEHRTCTRSRLARGLATHHIILTEKELEALMKKYTVPQPDGNPSDEVNYYQFVQDVDPSQVGVSDGGSDGQQQQQQRDTARGGTRLIMSAWGNTAKGGSAERPATDVDAVLQHIADQAEERQLRVAEFFIDFDPLRSGVLPKEKLVTALGIAGLELNETELQVLQSTYCCEKPANYVNVQQLLRDLAAYAPESVPTATLLATGTMRSSGNGSAKVAGASCRTLRERDDAAAAAAMERLSEEEQKQLERILQRLAHDTKAHSALLTPFFADFDRFKHGKITRTNFLQAVARHRFPVSEGETDILCRYYEVPPVPSGLLDYRRFVRDIGCDGEAAAAAAASSTMTTNSPNDRGSSTPSAQPLQGGTSRGAATTTFSECTVQGVLDGICCYLQERRPRLEEFFPDGDELRHRHVTAPRFRHCLTVLGLQLTEPEYTVLEEAFACSMMPGEVDYPAFVQTVRDMLRDGAGLQAVSQRRMGAASSIRLLSDTTPQQQQQQATSDGSRSPPSQQQTQEEGCFNETMAKIRRALASRRTACLPALREYDRARKGHVKEAQFFACLLSLGVRLTPRESDVLTTAYRIGNGEMGYITFAQAVDEEAYAETS